MRVTTLKAAGVSGLVAYYTGLGSERGGAGAAVGYYLDADEPPGQWWGASCAAVGLGGQVEAGELANMLDARHPHTGARLGRSYGERSARGFDATFSAPKSVSLLWALSPDARVRAEVLAAHDTAIDAALGWLEHRGCVTRRGRDGVDQVDAAGLCVARFRQHTSRAGDPQLHTHAVIWAKVQDPAGRWLALDARFLLKQQRSIGWVYDAALRSELTRRLGVEWGPVPAGAGQSDLTAIPYELRKEFSQRTKHVHIKLAELVDRWVLEHDGTEPDPRTLWQLERRAVLASRPPKHRPLRDLERQPLDEQTTRGDLQGTSRGDRQEHPEQEGGDRPGQPTDGDLRQRWRTQARTAGFDPDRLTTAVTSSAPMVSTVEVDREAVIAEAVARVAEAGSSWLEADLAREIAALVPPPTAADAAGLAALVDGLAMEAAERCVELHPPALPSMSCWSDRRPTSEHVVDRALTTEAILVQERWLDDWAQVRVDPPDPDAASPDVAVGSAIGGWGRLVLVVGPAGTGKTTAIRAGVRLLGTDRRPVLGLAPSGKAADVLTETAGCSAVTVASLLHSHQHGRQIPESGTTIILDEAGMTSTADLDLLVTLAEKRRWRLVCVGDPEQLPAVGRGGVFARWCDTLPAHRLEEVRRFTEPWQAQASLALRAGDPAAADAYYQHGRVATAHPALVARQVADRYLTHDQAGESVAITTASADTARAINIAIQQRLRVEDPVDRSVELRDGTTVRVGDRIATRLNRHDLTTTSGVQVRNRHMWDITHIGPDGTLEAHDPERGRVLLPAPYARAHVELGWAVTGYGNQGVTTDHGICVIEPASTRAGIYVGLTRGRGHNAAIIVDPTGLGDAADTLAGAIARPPNARTAHATRDRLYQERGMPSPDAEREPPAIDRPIDPYRPLAADQPQLDPPTQSLAAAQPQLDAAARQAHARSVGRGLSL